MNNRLTYEQATSIDWVVYNTSINHIHNGWTRRGESTDGKFYYEEDYSTGDKRVIESKTGKEVWSYYADFYTG